MVRFAAFRQTRPMPKQQKNNLFAYSLRQRSQEGAPLADRMRPQTLEDFIGQEHILGKGRLLWRAIQADRLSSLIFYGPPGTGKTTLARIIARRTAANFLSLNAVLAGIKDIREQIEEAETSLAEQGTRSILFIDEVHRFNKSQQDALLPHVEKGTLTLIGATTENPYFEVNKALLSRSRIFQLKPLEKKDLLQTLEAALVDPERGFGKLNIRLEPEAKEHLAQVANGDARALLNALELAVITSEPDERGEIHINLSIAEESIQQKAVLYDKDGDAHFDHASALIKSLRGSDPDAALYWLAKMVYAGEDPRFLLRRMMILAAEDVGLADPQVLPQVVACAKAFDYIGLPEGRFHLAQACLILANAPKSNSAFGFFEALSAVAQEKEADPPNHLKDSSRDKKGLGHGEGYQYPHAFKDHWVAQQYLPQELQGKFFYKPGNQGYEGKIRRQVAQRKLEQLAQMNAPGAAGWKERALGSGGQELAQLKEVVFKLLSARSDSMVLNLNAQSGWLAYDIAATWINPSLYLQVFTPRDKEIAESQFKGLETVISQSGSDPFEEWEEKGYRFDLLLSYNLLWDQADKAAWLHQAKQLLLPEGQWVGLEQIPRQGSLLTEILETTPFPHKLLETIKGVEQNFLQDRANPKFNWSAPELADSLAEAGLQLQHKEEIRFTGSRWIIPEKIKTWFDPQHPGPYGKLLKQALSAKEQKFTREALLERCQQGPVPWRTAHFLFQATR